ncbi:MAG: SusC/RagA family TonB-linked outer membrane protein [Tangfeifania sp.]
MKVTLLLLLVSVVSVLAGETYAQSTKLTLQLNNAQINEVLLQVEEQSEFRFFYNENVDVEERVSVNVKNQTVFDILNDILKGTNIQYKVIGRQIALFNSGESSDVLIQQNSISGTVTGQDGEPMPGVSVVIKGTTTGTITDANGNYSLTAMGDDVLVFSFIGMKKQEVPVNDRSTIDVLLEEETIGVEEVVVIGYGTREKKDLTGAVSQIDSEELQKEIKMSPELSMQGKMPGVFISNPGSDPNSRPSVRIRGVSTLGYNDPLYVVDGVPITEGGASGSSSRVSDLRGNVNVLNMINPNDIESISVLKDASATAIYGVRASNGVILITTKRGSEGRMNINLSARYGIQNVYKDYDILSTPDYVMMHREAWENNKVFNEDPDILRFYDSGSQAYLGDNPTYDWQSAGKVKNAVVQDYNVSISGGNEVSNYSVGSGYSEQENAMFSDNFQRYSFFLNSDHNLTPWLKVGESFRFAYTKSEFNGGGDAFAPPWQPLYDEDGFDGFALPGRTIDGEFVSRGYGNSTRDNFLGNAKYKTSIYNLIRNLGSFYAEISPVEGFAPERNC